MCLMRLLNLCRIFPDLPVKWSQFPEQNFFVKGFAEFGPQPNQGARPPVSLCTFRAHFFEIFSVGYFNRSNTAFQVQMWYTTVPQSLSNSRKELGSRHVPTRRSLRHSRMMVLSRTGSGMYGWRISSAAVRPPFTAFPVFEFPSKYWHSTPDFPVRLKLRKCTNKCAFASCTCFSGSEHEFLKQNAR